MGGECTLKAIPTGSTGGAVPPTPPVCHTNLSTCVFVGCDGRNNQFFFFFFFFQGRNKNNFDTHPLRKLL